MRRIILVALASVSLIGAAPVSAQTLAPKPIEGQFEQSLKLLTPLARREAKAERLAALGKLAKFPALHKGRLLEIEMKGAPLVEGGALVVYARVRVDGAVRGLGVKHVEWERFRFVNPPVKVPDGTHREEVMNGETTLLPNTVEDSGAAMRAIIADAVGLIMKTGPPASWGSVGRTTTTIYPDAGDNTGGTVDGNVRSHKSAGSGIPFVTLWGSAGTGKSAVGDPDHMVRIIADTTTDNWRWAQHGFLGFDTSDIGGNTISLATLSLRTSLVSDNFTTPMNPDIHIVSGTLAVNDTIANSDFGAWGSTSFASAALGSITTGDFHDWDLNASGIAHIDGSGVTIFSVVTDDILSETEPAWESGKEIQYRVYLAEHTFGDIYDPKLVIEHEGAASGSPAMIGIPF